MIRYLFWGHLPKSVYPYECGARNTTHHQIYSKGTLSTFATSIYFLKVCTQCVGIVHHCAHPGVGTQLLLVFLDSLLCSGGAGWADLGVDVLAAAAIVWVLQLHVWQCHPTIHHQDGCWMCSIWQYIECWHIVCMNMNWKHVETHSTCHCADLWHIWTYGTSSHEFFWQF